MSFAIRTCNWDLVARSLGDLFVRPFHFHFVNHRTRANTTCATAETILERLRGQDTTRLDSTGLGYTNRHKLKHIPSFFVVLTKMIDFFLFSIYFHYDRVLCCVNSLFFYQIHTKLFESFRVFLLKNKSLLIVFICKFKMFFN